MLILWEHPTERYIEWDIFVILAENLDLVDEQSGSIFMNKFEILTNHHIFVYIHTGTQLEDINEADEDTISVSVDSRPSSRQQAQRPTSGRRSIISRPRSSRSRPLSARSGASSEREHVNGK